MVDQTRHNSCIIYPYTSYLDIPAGVANQHILEVPLVPPDVLTTAEDQCVTVTITIGLDTTWADGRSDHDPHFGVSDGERFNGFIVVDKNNCLPPCYSAEGDDVKDVLKNLVDDSSGVKLSNPSQGYSSEVKIQIRPCEKWGSYLMQHAEGFRFIKNYQRQLDLTKGLYFNMYRHNAGETYRIEHIRVDVEMD
ncbi:uncharacterized protein [Dysidea avara]|uniref:uncharacterized protein n=1 Tax=Dysidea avara TaxID=196820 RepID=UPI00332E4836